MNDLLIGLVAIAVGAEFCFRGYLARRVIIPTWGLVLGPRLTLLVRPVVPALTAPHAA
jgi:hypothetical protein